MLLTMTDDELLRIKLVQDICDKRLTGVEAARTRQVQRLVTRFRQLGAAGLVHQRRGKPTVFKQN